MTGVAGMAGVTGTLFSGGLFSPASAPEATVALVVTLLGVGGALLFAVRRAWPRAPRALGIAAAAFLLWLGATGALGASGYLRDWSGMPPRFLRFMGVCVLLSTALALSPVGRRIAAALSFRALIGFHAFRIGAEILIFLAYSQGIVPRAMTGHGRNFDLITGLVALGVALLPGAWQTRPWARAAVRAFQILGLALLANVVITAALCVPGELRRFTSDTPNVWIGYFPWIWLPAVLVTFAWMGHLLIFLRLWRDGRRGSGRW